LATERFSIRFLGEAVESGVIDVKDLAPTLLAVGELIEESNRVLNGDRASVKVGIRPDFQSGSFEGTLELAVSFFEFAKNVFSKDKPLDARQILDAIGFSVTTVGAVAEAIPSLYELVRRIGLRKPTSVMKLEAGDTRLTLDDAEVLKTLDLAVDLYSDDKVSRALVRVGKALTERTGIDAIQMGIALPGSDSLPMEYTKKDAPILEALEEKSEAFEVLGESTSVRVFGVKRVDFSGDLKWALHDGKNRFHASILDTKFLQQVQHGEIAFASDTLIRAESKEIQTLTATGKLNSRYEILKVLEIISASTQGRLDLPQLPEDGDEDEQI